MKRSGCLIALLAPAVLLLAPRADAQGAAAAPPAETAAPPPAAAAPAPAAAPAEASTGGQQKDGFAFEPHFYAQLFSGGVAGNALLVPLVIGGIFGGYKLDRLIVGLGFDFTSYDAGGGAQIVMHWKPGLRYTFLRSKDERAELFGQADLGFGHDFGAPASNEIIDVDLGLGLRYWVHPQIALGAVGGWNSEWMLTQPPAPFPAGSAVTMGTFSGIQVLGVF